MCPRGDLNTETGEISLIRGNHATKITRAGPGRTDILPGVRYLPRHLACARRVADAGDWLPGLPAAAVRPPPQSAGAQRLTVRASEPVPRHLV